MMTQKTIKAWVWKTGWESCPDHPAVSVAHCLHLHPR